MIAATNSMAGGTMVTAPGLTYAKGFSGGIIYYAGFLTAAFGLGAVGLKAAIMKQRIGAVSFLDLYRLRFRSKAVDSALAITCVVGLLFTTCAQITAGAKMFAAITGSNQYYLGLLLVIVITVIYTSTGGVKSMAKVAAIQGVVMLIATFSIMGILLIDNAKLYGSLGAAVEYMGTTYPEMLPSGVAGIIFCGVFAWLISLILMVVVSLATQKDKVPLGYFQVFFCDDYDPNGDFQAGQMYVQYTRLADPVVPYPVCMVHGGGGTGALWETTQAGEPGWEYMFLQNGFHVNVSDGVERGRASWAQFPEINPVPPASTATLNVGLPTGSVPNTRRAMQEAASMPVNTTPL